MDQKMLNLYIFFLTCDVIYFCHTPGYLNYKHNNRRSRHKNDFCTTSTSNKCV